MEQQPLPQQLCGAVGAADTATSSATVDVVVEADDEAAVPQVTPPPATEEQQQQQQQALQQLLAAATANTCAATPTPTSTPTQTPQCFEAAAAAILAQQQQSQQTVINTARFLGDDGVAPFVAKLYELVNNPNTQSLISWSIEHNKQAFVVWDTVEFSATLLPRYFKHSNFCSFVRQLNIYGFHKIESKEGYTFMHENFRYNCPQLLKSVQRRKPVHKSCRTSMSSCAPESDPPEHNSDASIFKYIFTEIADIQKQNDDLQQLVRQLHETVQGSVARQHQMELRLQRIADFLVFYSPLNRESSSAPARTSAGEDAPALSIASLGAQALAGGLGLKPNAGTSNKLAALQQLQQQRQEEQRATSATPASLLQRYLSGNPEDNAQSMLNDMLAARQQQIDSRQDGSWDLPAAKGQWHYGTPAV